MPSLLFPQSVCLCHPVFVSFCFSVCPSVCLFCLSLSLSLCLCQPVFVSFCFSVSVCLSVCLSLCLSLPLCLTVIVCVSLCVSVSLIFLLETFASLSERLWECCVAQEVQCCFPPLPPHTARAVDGAQQHHQEAETVPLL